MQDEQAASIVGQRLYPRFGYEVPVAFRKLSSSPVIDASLVDLSIGGCLFQTDAPVSLALSDFIEIKLKSTCLSLRLMAWIRHANPRTGLYGVEFHRLGEREASFLGQIVDELVPQLNSTTMPPPRFEPSRETVAQPELVMSSGPRARRSR